MSFEKKQEKEYDMQAKSKAVTGFGMRLLVSGYILWVSWQVLSGALSGQSPIPMAAAVLLFLAFAGTALWFVYYAWRSYQKALTAAELPPQEPPQETPEEPQD